MSPDADLAQPYAAAEAAATSVVTEDPDWVSSARYIPATGRGVSIRPTAWLDDRDAERCELARAPTANFDPAEGLPSPTLAAREVPRA